jgi:amino acid adenylation domain-containing protein
VAIVLHRLLTEAADQDPDHEAVRFQGRGLTFGQLERRSNSLARALAEGGVRPGDRVALFVNKGLEQITSVHAILKAGAAYVPLDVTAPIQRQAVIVADTEPAAMITTASRARDLVVALGSEFHPGLAVLTPEVSQSGSREGAELPMAAIEFETAATAAPDAGAPDVHSIDRDLACLLYTSGSTGAPKGAMLTHRNALSLAQWWADLSGMRPGDRELGFSPLQFVASINDVFATLIGRATLVLMPEHDLFSAQALGRCLQDERITLWMGAPPIFMVLLKGGWAPGSFPMLRAALWGGSVFPTKHVRALQQLLPNARLRSMLGSTEACQVTVHEIREIPQDDQPIPIGRPCANVDAFALREDGQPAGPGDEGELYIRSSSVFQGYWRNPERSAEVLVPDPLHPDLPGPVYRSRDLVRVLPDGNFVFVGRRDQMIKTRGGFRVEPAEIEAAMVAHPSVLEAAVVPVPHTSWGYDIVAYVQPKGDAPLTEEEIKAHVADRLPKYMVPRRI